MYSWDLGDLTHMESSVYGHFNMCLIYYKFILLMKIVALFPVMWQTLLFGAKQGEKKIHITVAYTALDILRL